MARRAVHLVPRRAPRHPHERVRIVHRQGTQEHDVGEAEDGGVRANAERQRQHGERGERRRSAHHPRGVPKILQTLLDRDPSPGGLSVLASQFDVAEIDPGASPSLGRGFARQLPVVALRLEVEAQLFVELLPLPPTREQPTHFSEEGTHWASCATAFKTSIMARENLSHLVSSPTRCFRPAVVSR